MIAVKELTHGIMDVGVCKMNNKCKFCREPFNVEYEIICPTCGYDHEDDKFITDYDEPD